MDSLTIGLFGTCGASTWRNSFIEAFKSREIRYFNPLVADWSPVCAVQEAWHLANDRIIAFPVTDETYGFGSLAESGFSLYQAISKAEQTFVLTYVAPDVCAELKASNPSMAKESYKARTLALAHLNQIRHPNIFQVQSLDEMLTKSIALYKIAQDLQALRA